MIGNAFTAYLHKRVIFDYEREYRAVCTESNPDGKEGLLIKVDLNKLVQNIFLAPYTKEEVFQNVLNIVKSVNKDFNVRRSSFDLSPYY